MNSLYSYITGNTFFFKYLVGHGHDDNHWTVCVIGNMYLGILLYIRLQHLRHTKDKFAEHNITPAVVFTIYGF